jgi:DNA repair protein SbcC/Rad50
MSNFRLMQIKIDHFRGYKEEQIFDLENASDFIILAGANGYGKTSFYDAIEWCFTGKLYRYEEPNEEKINSHFINFQPSERAGYVALRFGNESEFYELTRKVDNYLNNNTDYGNKKSTVVLTGTGIQTLKNTKAMEKINQLLIRDPWKDKLTFENVFSQYHLLTQDKLKAFVCGLKGTARYNSISNMIGTVSFSKYLEHFSNLKTEFLTKNEELKRNQEKLTDKISILREDILQEDISLKFETINEEDAINGITRLINELILKINIEEYTIREIFSNFNEFHKFFKDKIAILKNAMTIEKNRNLDVKTELTNLYNRVDIYNNYFKKREEFSSLISSVEKYNDYKYILNNSNDFQAHNLKLIELDQEIESISFHSNKLNIEITDIKATSHDIEELLKEVKNLNNPTYEKQEKIANIIISKLTSLTDKITPKNKYIVELEKMMEIKNETNEFCNTRKNNAQLMSSINNDIKILSATNETIKNVLNESLAYIKSLNEQNISCPLCNTTFKKLDLIRNIESNIEGENPLLKQKLKDLKEVEEEELKISANLKLIEKEFNILLNQFVKLLEEDNDKCKKTFIQKDNENKNLIKEILAKKEIKNNEVAKQEKIISLINKYKLSQKSEELKLIINSMLEELVSKNPSNYIETIEIGEILRLKDETENNIANYEKNLLKFQIDINQSTLNEEVKRKIDIIAKEVDKIANNEASLKQIETDEISFYSIFTKNKKYLELKSLETEVANKNLEIQKNNNAIEMLNILKTSSEKIISDENKRILEGQKSFVNEIFRKIFQQPFFEKIHFSFEKTNQNSDTLKILCLNKDDKTINPAFTFSSAQVNTVAISIFLSIALRQNCTNLTTILMDDPIQSMDDLNVFAFIDILRSFVSDPQIHSKGKQFVLSTHDEKMYKLMKKKFRFLNSKSFEFESYNLRGPRINCTDSPQRKLNET